MNRAGSAANNPISDARCSSLALYSSLAEYSFVHFNRLFWQSSVDTMSGWTQCMVPRTILSYIHKTKQPFNHHKNTTVSLYLQLAVVQCMITEGSGRGQFWQCRKCGHWDQRPGGDHNGVINMTLLCNQWSVSHNGLSLGAPEVMTHDNGTQWSLHTVVMQTPANTERGEEQSPGTAQTQEIHHQHHTQHPAISHALTDWIWSELHFFIH